MQRIHLGHRLAPAALCALVFALPSCGGSEPAAVPGAEADASAADGPRDMLVYAAGTDLQSTVPVVYSSVSDSYVIDNIFMPTIDSGFDCSLSREPGLATEWSWNEDGTKLNFKLRDDIKWADGKPVTAHDIAFSYELIGDPEVTSPRVSALDHMVKGATPKVLGDYELEFEFTKAYDRDSQSAHANMQAMPRHALEGADRGSLRTHEINSSPIANGPWRLESHKPGQQFVLAPNEQFTGPAEMNAKLKRVMFKVVPQYQTRLLQLKKGEIDMMDGIQVADADSLAETNPEFNIVRRGYRFMDYIAWNLKNEKFQDKRVRQAFAHAVNVETMIAKLLTRKSGEVLGRPAIGTITPELCGVHNDDIQRFAHDLDKAKALMAEAGWTDTDGDGWVDKDGQKFSFTLITNRENARRMEAAAMTREALKAIGVDMALDTMEFNAMTDKTRHRDFEAVLGGWSAALYVDPSSFWHSPEVDADGKVTKEYQFNYTSYANAEVDALIDQGLATPRPEDAAPIWKELQAKIYDDQPYLFLFWRDDLVAIHNRFENVQINTLSLMFHLNEWEVPADKVKYDF